MNKLLKKEILAAVFVFFAGSLLHFVFDWSGRIPAVGLISPVNESTWEHLKLLFYPMLIVTAVQYIFRKNRRPDLLFGKAMGILAGCAAILVIFYSYTGIVGQNFLAADILVFALGTLVAFLVDYYILSSEKYQNSCCQYAGGILLLFMLALFFVFTLYPPQIALFQDPVTGGYGIA